LPVVGSAGDVVGIITESDLFEVLVQQLDRSDALFAESPAK
jgi:CBS domain-containing protein